MGKTMDQAIVNAEEMLRDYIEETEKRGWEVAPPSLMENVETPPGHTLVSIPLIRPSGRTIRASLQLDEGTLAFIDDEARRRDMTRNSYVTWMTRRIAQMGG